MPTPGGVWSGGPGGDPPGTVTAAGGKHPTGMHSCCPLQSFRDYLASSIRSYITNYLHQS